MMPITYANNFLQYDKSIVAFKENDEEITYGYVETTIEKNFGFSNGIYSTIHCFMKNIFCWKEFNEVTTSEKWCYSVTATNNLCKIQMFAGCISLILGSLHMKKTTLPEALSLIKDNYAGMSGASKEIKELVHDKFREMLVPSYKMFILGQNDDSSVINIIPKDVVFEIIKLSNK